MINEVPYSRVAPWRARAAREHVDISDTRNTRWFMDHSGVAVAGLMILPNGGYRLKGVYVDPAFRKLGIGRELTDHRLAVAEQEAAPFVECFTWTPEWWILELGFEVAGRNGHGAVLVRKPLEKKTEN